MPVRSVWLDEEVYADSAVLDKHFGFTLYYRNDTLRFGVAGE
jgi:hypothetical protein